MRTALSFAAAAWLLAAGPAFAMSAEELVQKNIEAKGGIDKLKAIESWKLSGKMNFSGGDFSVDLGFTQMQRRDNKLRTEASLQGLTQVTAYDGKEGWNIQPFQGRRDPQRMTAEENKGLEIQADIDGPLVDWQAKGHKLEYQGLEDVDGTEAHKLKVTLKNGDVQYYYFDPDYFLEIRVISSVKRRGVEIESETDLGNYEQIAGVYVPFSLESGAKGGPKGQKITIEKAEPNVKLDDALFAFPAAAAAAPAR